MREIAVIQVGQCGNQIGAQFWEDICQEHGIGWDGALRGPSAVQLERINVYFEERSRKTYTPRSILVDLDKSGLDHIRNREIGQLFPPDNFLSGVEGTGSVWAKAFSTDGQALVEPFMEIMRRTVEECDLIQGFQFIHALGGGTGSGMSSILMSNIRDEFSGRTVNTFSVLPSPRVSDMIVEPYNCVLSLQRLIDDSDGTVCFDNEALYRICEKTFRQSNPDYNDFNVLVSKAMCGLTTCFRFAGDLNVDLKKLYVNLVPFPKLHFFCPGINPMLTNSGEGFKPPDLESLVDLMFLPQGLMAECDPGQGRYLSAAAFFRVPHSSTEIDREVKRAVAKIGRFVDFVPNGIKCGLAPTSSPALSVTHIVNTTSVQEVFRRQLTPFLSLYKKKAFFRVYEAEGMDIEELLGAARKVDDLALEYVQYQDAPCVMSGKIRQSHSSEIQGSLEELD